MLYMITAAIATTLIYAAWRRRRRKMGPVGGGLWMYLWPKDGWHALEPAQSIPRLKAWGIRGVIVHSGLTGGNTWLTPARKAAFANQGIQCSVGIAMDGPRDEAAIIAAIIAAYDNCGSVVLDAESAWEHAGGKDAADRIASGVLAARPGAKATIVDVPWWKPSVHDSFPTTQFGRMCAARFVQAYGAPGNGSLGMLQHARTERLYHGDRVMGTFQAYRRSYEDQLATLRAEPNQVLWNLAEIDDACDRALRENKGVLT